MKGKNVLWVEPFFFFRANTRITKFLLTVGQHTDAYRKERMREVEGSERTYCTQKLFYFSQLGVFMEVSYKNKRVSLNAKQGLGPQKKR